MKFATKNRRRLMGKIKTGTTTRVKDEVKKYDSYVIYGAQVIAVGAREAIAHLTGKQPVSFAVGKPAGKTWFPTGNPEEIDGIPGVSIDAVSTDAFIVLGIWLRVEAASICGGCKPCAEACDCR